MYWSDRVMRMLSENPDTCLACAETDCGHLVRDVGLQIRDWDVCSIGDGIFDHSHESPSLDSLFCIVE